jgi:hypothetical protein
MVYTDFEFLGELEEEEIMPNLEGELLPVPRHRSARPQIAVRAARLRSRPFARSTLQAAAAAGTRRGPMTQLISDLFRGDSKLEGALTVDAKHITRGAAGPHVSKIQSALILLLDPPPLIIAYGSYDATTAAAVLRYKTERAIINFAYQTIPDDIVGKMTMRSLDNEMVALEAEVGSAFLGILTRLDELLHLYQTALSPDIRVRCENIRLQALNLAAPGGFRRPTRRVGYAYSRDLRYMDELTKSYRRPAVVFAIAPAIALAAALGAFIILIGAVIAIIIVNDQVGRFGKQVNKAIEAALDAGEAAVVENAILIDRLDAAVTHCQQISLNPTPACLKALARFAIKKVQVIAKRTDLQGILANLREALKGGLSKFIWKKLAMSAESAGKDLAKLTDELRDIVADIIKECGCQFIRV